jgi:hypothetical protein
MVARTRLDVTYVHCLPCQKIAVGTEKFFGATRGHTVSTKRYSHIKTLQMSLEFDTDIHTSAVHELYLFEHTDLTS